MTIPTESIGSIPRTSELLDAMAVNAAGILDDARLAVLAEQAVADTLTRMTQTGSPVLTDGEQTKPSFATYPLNGLALDPAGVVIPFADGHTRQLPTITTGPFRYGTRAVSYLRVAQLHTDAPLKQAVIAPSAMSLLYPPDGLDGYSRESFLADLMDEAEADIREALNEGADSMQLDFTEGRLSLKLDPSGAILEQFIALNNQVLDRFNSDERARIGVHTCPGGDQDSTHSADIPYADLLPKLFELRVGRFYIALAGEENPDKVLAIIGDHRPPLAQVFVGVIDVLDPKVETPDLVRDRVLAAAAHIPLPFLGTCDDCGFSPFADDASTSRDTAFAKIAARVQGTALAALELGA